MSRYLHCQIPYQFRGKVSVQMLFGLQEDFLLATTQLFSRHKHAKMCTEAGIDILIGGTL